MLTVIKKLKTLVNLPLIPLQSDKLQEQIIYEIIPNNDNGVTSQSTLKLNIICDTLAKCELIDKQIRQGLLSYGDTNTLDSVLNITLNGGGTLTSEKYVHRFINLVIKSKNERNEVI